MKKVYIAKRIPKNSPSYLVLNIKPSMTIKEIYSLYTEKILVCHNYIYNGPWILRPPVSEDEFTENHLPTGLQPKHNICFIGFLYYNDDMNIRPNALVIIKKNNQLLSLKGIDEKTGKVFYRLLGGGIEFGENSEEALAREIKEELNATIINEKLLLVTENIFEFNDKKYHEITFLYNGDLLEENLYNEKSIKIADKEDKYTEWIPISEIKNGNIIVYPSEAIDYL